MYNAPKNTQSFLLRPDRVTTGPSELIVVLRRRLTVIRRAPSTHLFYNMQMHISTQLGYISSGLLVFLHWLLSLLSFTAFYRMLMCTALLSTDFWKRETYFVPPPYDSDLQQWWFFRGPFNIVPKKGFMTISFVGFAQSCFQTNKDMKKLHWKHNLRSGGHYCVLISGW